jgi:phosphohistidine phosphatase
MLIYFLRHGDASSNARFHDSERPLSERGQNQASCVARFLHQSKTSINVILTSPLKRAWETGEIIQSIIHAPQCEKTDDLLNGTDPEQLFQQIEELDVESVLLVGHEPFLSDTISLLIGGNHIPGITMGKCSLALVEIVELTRPGTGTLKQLLHIQTLSLFVPT